MAIAELINQSPTVGTGEYSVTAGTTSGPSTSAADGFYQIFLDLNALAAGDVFQLKMYERVNAGTQRLFETWTFSGVQGKPGWASPGFMLMDGWDFTLKKVSGTDRSIPHSVRQAT